MTEPCESRKTNWKLIALVMSGLGITGLFVSVSACPDGHLTGSAPSPIFYAKPIQGPGFMMDGPGPMHMLRMIEELGLSNEQRDTIGEIMDNAIPKARKLRFALIDNRKALKALATAKTFDEKATERRAKDVAEKVAELILLRTSSAANMRAVLTSEQRQHFDELYGMHQFHRGKPRMHHRNMENHPPTRY